MLKQSVLRRMQYWQDYKVCEFFRFVHMIKNGHLVASMAHRLLALFYLMLPINLESRRNQSPLKGYISF